MDKQPLSLKMATEILFTDMLPTVTPLSPKFLVKLLLNGFNTIYIAICYFHIETNNSHIYVISPSSTGNVTLSATDTYPKQITTQVDLTSAGAKAGDKGVLQAYYVSSDGNETWYQCADISLVAAASSAPTIASGAVMFYTILAVILMTNGHDYKF